LANSFCNTAVTPAACKIKGASGTDCVKGTGCVTGYCYDGVCCNQACGGQCQTCKSDQNPGSCVPIIGDPTLAGHPPCAGASTDCKGLCKSDNQDTCSFPSIATPCGKATCNGDVSTPASTCDGVGECAPATSKNCPPYACNTTSGDCKQSCSTTADCAQGASCDTSTGKCAITAGTCIDPFTMKSPDGQITSCAPYRCKNGACQATCATDLDCADGASCKATTCVPADAGTAGAGGGSGGGATGGSGGDKDAGTNATAPAAADEGGCGCRTAGDQRTSGKLLLLLPALLLRRRAKKRASHLRREARAF
jgi:MYXO-CTERM domain-containing protein